MSRQRGVSSNVLFGVRPWVWCEAFGSGWGLEALRVLGHEQGRCGRRARDYSGMSALAWFTGACSGAAMPATTQERQGCAVTGRGVGQVRHADDIGQGAAVLIGGDAV